MANNKYWVGILYPENMSPTWQEDIGDLIQLPYAYCIHDKDLDKDGDCATIHVHLIIAFKNTTTYKHALSVFEKLSAPGKRAINTCEPIINIRNKYNYLIHDTEESKKKGKYQYDPKERITGNNFDIAHFEQVSVQDKNIMCMELCTLIIDKGFTNFGDFYSFVFDNFISDNSNYFDIIKSYSGLFERLTKSNFQKKYVR